MGEKFDTCKGCGGVLRRSATGGWVHVYLSDWQPPEGVPHEAEPVERVAS